MPRMAEMNRELP